MTTRSELYAAQDDCLIAIADGNPVPMTQLRSLPPWRAVLIGRVARRAGVMDQATLTALQDAARDASGAGQLGEAIQLKIQIQPATGQIFGPTAFDANLGRSVPFLTPDGRRTLTTLIDAEIVPDGSAARLTFEVVRLGDG